MSKPAALFAFAIFAAAPALASAGDAERSVWAYEEARFEPVDPKRPELAQIAVLRGDPETGPSDMLLRMAGGPGVPHVHTADYRLVLIEGEMLYREGLAGEARRLGPGSYWFQRGGEPHGNSCLVERCTMFVSWSDKRDARRAEAAPEG